MSLLSAIGGLIGLSLGGPLGAALGSGIGTLAGGGDIGDALKSGLLGFGIGSIPGLQGMVGNVAGAAGLQGVASRMAAAQAAPNMIGQALSGMGGALGMVPPGGATAAAAGMPMGQAVAQGVGSLLQFGNNPLVMSALMAAERSQDRDIMTPLQRRQAETGERLPDYRGTPSPELGIRPGRPNVPVPVTNNYARGGMVQGPGTGKSDSIPARIYQRGRPVEEARLSDGEFVMTNRAVRGAGNGDRMAGAAKMYRMMQDFERRA